MAAKEKRQQAEDWQWAKEWIKVISKEELKASDLMLYQPKTEWFLHGPLEDHEGDHLGRVLILSQLLGRMLKASGKIGEEINLEAVAWGAVLHDVYANGVKYPVHGKKAAEWVGENWQKVGLPEEMVEMVSYICAWHVSDGEEIPEMTVELSILKHADSLDRNRFPKPGDVRGLDESFLTLPFSRFLVPIAKELFERTRSGYDSVETGFEAVIKAGVEMGLISE